MTLCSCGAERPPKWKFCPACLRPKHIQGEGMVEESRLASGLADYVKHRMKEGMVEKSRLARRERIDQQGAGMVEKSRFAGRERIDQQWNAVMPMGWSTWGNDGGMHSGERGMLYDILDEDEGIEALVGGRYRAEQDTNRLAKHSGVAVATNKRVIFLDKGVLGSKEVSEMPYRSIEGITHSTGMMFGGVQITGVGRASWRIEDVRPKGSAKLFADSVRGLVESYHTGAARTAGQKADSPMSAPEELEKWAKLRNDGILTQEEFDAKKRQLLGL